jgi:acetyl esterase/lipase
VRAIGLIALAVILTQTEQVRTVRDARYYQGADEHPRKHLLDLYLPVRSRGFPLLAFVHGGAWTQGDKDAFGGAYGRMAKSLVVENVAVAVINYRLTPEVQHPEHARDVARAAAWLHRHAGEYGWAPDRVFLIGHSAGAHLSALVAVDGAFLKEQGLTPRVIRGVVGISGVYDLTLTGVTGRFLYEPVFGSRTSTLRSASPALSVTSKTCPFLLLYAENDYPTLRLQTLRFERALRDHGAQAASRRIRGRDHIDIVTGLARPADPVRAAILDFVRRN